MKSSLEKSLTIGALSLIFANVFATAIVSQAKWRLTLFSLISYFLHCALYILFLILIGDPNHTVGEDDPGDGIILPIVGIPPSLISFIFGMLLEITIIALIKQVKNLNISLSQ